MIVAIMQPYFFPYIGYFQLMHAVDAFVFFDDVQYIDRGWVNRNRIPLAGKSTWLSMPVIHAERTLAINQREYLLDVGAGKILRKIEAAYKNAAARDEAGFIADLIGFRDPNVASFNANLLERLAGWLGIDCTFQRSSQILGPCALKGEDRLIAICTQLGATEYVNPIGGITLYDPRRFRAEGVDLTFIKTTTPPTASPTGDIHYSIIDLLMRLGLSRTRSLLLEYELTKAVPL